jgi:distribution and morphology protein 31
VTEAMTGHGGRTLFTNFWKHVNPFFRGAQGTSSSSRFSQQRSFNDSLHDILGRNPFRTSSSPFSSYPRNPRQITRRFASGGFFVLTTSPNSTAAVESGTACAISPEKVTCYGASRQLDRGRLTALGRSAWNRNFHTSRRVLSRREITKEKDNQENLASEGNSLRHPEVTTNREATNKRAITVNSHEPLNGPARNHYLRAHLHRPTREELLAAATGFWSRLKVRFKWFSIRSVRPFNMDEIGALFSWVLLGHVLWVILGTTTFFSLLILAINTVFAQGMARPSDFIVINTNETSPQKPLLDG